MAPHDLGWQAQLQANLAHLVLEERAQRLDEREGEVVGQAADVVMAFDVGRPCAAARLDHIWIERALHEEVHRPPRLPRLSHDVTSRILKDADELSSDDFALLLRVAHPGERIQEALLCINDDQSDTGRSDEVALDLLGLACAQQAMVDEDTGELISHSTLHERGGHCGVHAARETADHETVSHLVADALNLVVDDSLGRPGRLQSGDSMEEVLEDLLAVFAMHDLGMELHAGEAAFDRLHGRHGCPRARRCHREARGSCGDGIAMGHPHGLSIRKASEER